VPILGTHQPAPSCGECRAVLADLQGDDPDVLTVEHFPDFGYSVVTHAQPCPSEWQRRRRLTGPRPMWHAATMPDDEPAIPAPSIGARPGQARWPGAEPTSSRFIAAFAAR
jgi:hypothetical protein